MKRWNSAGQRAFLGVWAGVLGAAALAAEPATRPFAHPDRIRYDRDCLTIEGKDTLIYSGAFHYFRCPKPLWEDRLKRIRAAGFNAVETYVAWNVHEREMPASLEDFSKVDLTDLEDFLLLAEKTGLYVIIRPGPYICAEWDSGGFPRWLATKRPEGYNRTAIWLRSDEAQFVAWSKHWYDAVCPLIAKHQITRKAPGEPGVILFQVENEYDFSGLPQDVKTNYVKALTQMALDHGIDVPIFTCWTGLVRGSQDPVLRHVFDSCNLYPSWKINDTAGSMDWLRKSQPDAPMMTAELQGGWFSTVGGALSENQAGYTPAQINNLTLFTLQHGETILNYYMLYGGSNLDDGAAAWMTQSYDYAAPIREHGGVGERYGRVWAIGQMLQEHGARLARAQNVPLQVEATQKDVTVALRKASDGGRYYFVRTSQHEQPRKGEAKVKSEEGELTIAYDLEPLGAAILYLPPGATDVNAGQWLPRPAPEIRRPAELPGAVEITSALRHADRGAERWTAVAPGQHREDMGSYDSKFLFYRVQAEASGAQLRLGSGAREIAGVVVNGKMTPRGGGRTVALPDGRAEVLMLHESPGTPNGGNGIEQLHGLTGARIAKAVGADTRLSRWRMHPVERGGGPHPETAEGFDDSAWPTVERLDGGQLKENQSAILRATLRLSDEECREARLTFTSIDDRGWVYVNGQPAGETRDWQESYSFDVTKLVHPGNNSVAVVVANQGGRGGLNEVLFEGAGDSRAAELTYTVTAGDAGKWYLPDADEKGWQRVAIAQETASLPDTLVTWYRMKFELPEVKAGIWVPWRLELKAAGDGFVYVNGHCLGRYWQQGPQYEFYLPECWLNFGAGKVNVVTVSLRPTEQGAVIQSAKVSPYSNFAEYR